MIEPDAHLLLAEIEIGELIEWLILLALYFLLPALSRMLRRKKSDEEAEAHETRPEFEPAERWEPEPAAPRPIEESEPVETPVPPETARPPVEAPEPPVVDTAALDDLEGALAAWRAVATPRIGRAAASRVEREVAEQVPAWSGAWPWTPEDADDARSAARAVEDLTAGVRAVSHPAERILSRTAEAMLDPVARAAAGPDAEDPPVLLPVGRQPSPDARSLAAAVDLLPLHVPDGAPAPARRVAFLEEAAAQVVMAYPGALDPVVSRALDRVVEVARERGPTSAPLRMLLRQDMVGTLFASGVVSAMAFRHTGPLAVLSEPPQDASTRTAHGLRAALARRAADRSVLVEDAAPPEEVEALAWDRVAEAIEGAMVEVPWGPGSGRGLRGLVPAWGPARDQRARDLGHALAAHRRNLGVRPSGAEALVAWRLALEEAGVALDRRTLGLLADAVEGVKTPRRPAVRKPAPAPGTDAQDSERGDAFVLQVLLGEPRARRHPAFRRGPRRMWRNRSRAALTPPGSPRG
ncbi:MAG: hypothetical protein ACQEXJ_05325 [Myxococcota bacterium]